MAPVEETHPSELWGMGQYIGPFLEKFGIDGKVGDFFDLMPQVDLDDIKRVGKEVWGTELKDSGAVTEALFHHAALQIPEICGDFEEYNLWSGDAFDKYKERAAVEADFFDVAGQRSKDVGDALVEFAETADSTLSDGLGVLIGVIGAIVGAGIGLVGAAGGAIAGALLGLVVGIVIAYLGVLVPKIVAADGALHELDGLLPPEVPE